MNFFKKTVVAIAVSVVACASFANVYVDANTHGVTSIEKVEEGLVKFTKKDGSVYYKADSYGKKYVFTDANGAQQVIEAGQTPNHLHGQYDVAVEAWNEYQKASATNATVDQLEATHQYHMQQAYAEAKAINTVKENHSKLVDDLNNADWSSIAGKDGVSASDVGKGLQAVHADTIQNLTDMNNNYASKLAAMEAKLAALEEKLNQPTTPSPAPTVELEKMHNHYQAQMKAMYEKLTADIDSSKPSEPNPPATDNGLTSDQIKDLEDYLNSQHGNGGTSTPDTGRLAGLESQVNNLYKELDTVNDGIAMSMAMSSMPQSTGKYSTMVGAGVGNYNGSSAVAVGVSHKFESITINLKGSTTSNGSNVGVSAGVGYQF